MMTGSFIKKSVSIVLSASLILGCAGIADIQAKKAARLSASRLNMETGEKTKIKIKNKSKKAVYLFKSSNKKTASVNKKGTVTAKKQGKATITVKEKIKKSTKKIGKVKITVTTPKQDNIVVQTNIPAATQSASPYQALLLLLLLRLLHRHLQKSRLHILHHMMLLMDLIQNRTV